MSQFAWEVLSIPMWASAAYLLFAAVKLMFDPDPNMAMIDIGAALWGTIMLFIAIWMCGL